MTNPNLIHSLRIFDLLLGPIQRILKRILPDQTEENLRDENFRRMVLVPLVDRILLSQVPEAALVPNGVRHALIERALDTLINDILIPESAANATVAGGEGIEGAMVAAGLPLIPTKIGLGVKAITLEIAEGVDAAQLQSEALSTTGAGWAFSQIPELPGFFRLKPKPDTHPTVSEAWDLATELSDLQSVAYAEPSIAQLPIAADAAPVAGIAGFGMQDHKVPGALADAQWSLKLTKAQDLWGAHQGHGIPIGHVDTGYTHHPEIFQNVDVFHGWDSWDNDKNAEDDLDPSFWDRLRTNLVVPAQPGHGTATSSIIASPVGKQSGHIGVMEVTGTAPQATIIPIRATPTVAILPTGSQEEVASGISAAVNRGARVISMSLGSPWGSRPLNIAVQRALDAGVIVCAAAGNVVLWEGAFTEVMYPAAYQGVIAVAGCDFLHRPWRDSCRGSRVVVTAPGTDVWHATAKKEGFFKQKVVFDTASGSGTSFAVATIAGMAACWLKHWTDHFGGSAAFIEYLGGIPRNVPAAFVQCLHQHAATPVFIPNGEPSDLPDYPTFNASDFGTGIINGETLLEIVPSAPQPLEPHVEAAEFEMSPDPASAIISDIAYATRCSRNDVRRALLVDLALDDLALDRYLSRHGRELLHHLASNSALRARLRALLFPATFIEAATTAVAAGESVPTFAGPSLADQLRFVSSTGARQMLCQ